MNDEEAIEELEDLQRAFGFHNTSNTEEYDYLRDEEPENYKTALAIETVLNLIEKQQAEIGRLTTNNEILQGELDRIGIKTLKLEKGSSTDDIITEIEKKDTLINTMQAEFERLENLEDDTDMLKAELKEKDMIIRKSIIEIEKFRQYFSEDLQPDFIRILEILKDKKVIDW